MLLARTAVRCGGEEGRWALGEGAWSQGLVHYKASSSGDHDQMCRRGGEPPDERRDMPCCGAAACQGNTHIYAESLWAAGDK